MNDGIPRPDWGPGGEARGVAVATPAYRSADEVPAGTAMTGYEVAALSQPGQVEPAGLPGELIRELTNTAEGFHAHLATLEESASRVLSEVKDPERFAADFDKLSPGVRVKALRTMWKHPGIGLLDLIDKTETQLTLSEAHEAEQWVRKQAGCLR